MAKGFNVAGNRAPAPSPLSCDPMKDPIQLSADQKMELVLSHRKALACRVNLTNLAEELKQHEANFQATVNRLVAELKVDGNEFVLDLDKLAFVPK